MQLVKNIIQDIKLLYKAENSIDTHLNIFSWCGMFAMLVLMCLISLDIVSLVDQSPIQDLPLLYVLILFLCASSMGVYFEGYLYKFARNILNGVSSNLPDMDRKTDTVLIKIFPLMFVWLLYYSVIAFLCVELYIFNIYVFSVAAILTVLTLPFVPLLFVKFSRKFEYDRTLFNPLILLKYMSKTFWKVFGIIITLSLIFLVFSVIIYFAFIKTAVIVRSAELSVGLRVLAYCIWTYLIFILRAVYTMEAVKFTELF